MPSARVPIAPSARLLRSVAVASALACSAAAAALLPGAVASADERAVATVVGELVHAWPDDEHAGTDATHEDSGPLTWVETADGDAVRVAAEDVTGIAAGSTVEVTVGAQVEDVAGAGAGLEPARAVLSADVLETPGTAAARPDAAGLTNQVTVVLVTPRGVARDGATEQQIAAAVNGPVADFWAEQTGGAVRLGVTASRGWTSTAAGCADPAALWNEVAGTVGFTDGPGRHLMLYVSDAAEDCSYALAEVGAATSTGGRMYVRDSLPSLIAHEFGHNFGLGHSSAVQCAGTVEDGACRTAGYRDFYDVMGASWSQLGSLNAAQAARLGVLPGAQQQTLTAQGGAASLTLAPLSGATGTRALRLTDAEGVDYWLEYRTASGRDAWLGTSSNAYRLQNGVLLRRTGALPDTSVLLDATPAASAGWDADLQAALPVGIAVPVSGGDFSIVVQGMAATGAVVTVTSMTTTAAPRPAPVASGAAGAAVDVLPATGELAGAPPAAGEAGDATELEHRPAQALLVEAALDNAASTSPRGAVSVPVTVTGLLALALLGFVARFKERLRRTAARRFRGGDAGSAHADPSRLSGNDALVDPRRK